MVKCSRELLDDSLNIGTALPNIITAAMAAEMDRVALEGTGVAPQPTGLRLTVGHRQHGPQRGADQLRASTLRCADRDTDGERRAG